MAANLESVFISLLPSESLSRANDLAFAGGAQAKSAETRRFDITLVPAD
jgi:hypothetical protein